VICRNHFDVEEGVHLCARCEQPFCGDCLVEIQGQLFCAACKAERLLDVRSGVDPMKLKYAGFGERAGAQVLDAMIFGIPCYAVAAAMLMIAQQTHYQAPVFVLLAYLPFFIAPPLYEGLMLALKKGRTVGKIAFRLRVVRADGSPITAAQAWGRGVMRVILGCLVVIDYLPYFFTDEKTTLHDMIAGTRVIAER